MAPHLSQVRQALLEHAEHPRRNGDIAQHRRDALMVALGVVHEKGHRVVEARGTPDHEQYDIDAALRANSIRLAPFCSAALSACSTKFTQKVFS